MRDFKLRQCIRETPDWQTKQKLSNPCEFSRKTITFEMYMCNDSGRHACKVTDRHVAALLWRSHFVEFQKVFFFFWNLLLYTARVPKTQKRSPRGITVYEYYGEPRLRGCVLQARPC